MTRNMIVIAGLVVAIVAALVTSQVVVAASGDVRDARDDQQRQEAARDDIREDVEMLEGRLREFTPLLGMDPTPVRDEPIELPTGVEESLLTGELAVGDFEDVFVDEGVVLRGVSAKEVTEVALQPIDTYPPKPQPPLEVKDGKRFVHVEFEVRNRIGDAADPGCGMGESIANRAYDDQGEFVPMSKAYEDAATYAEACGNGIADGASAPVAFTVQLDEDRKLAALMFSFLGEDSDSRTQTLVFDEPV